MLKIKDFMINIGISIGIILIFALLILVSMRFGFINGNAIKIGFENKIKNSEQNYVDNYEFSYTYQLNSNGFRDDEFLKSKPNGTIRLFLIGDSFVFGSGVDQNSTIDKFIELECQKRGNICEVYNLGIPAAALNTCDYISQEFTDFSPDAVIISFYVDNDIMNTDTLRSLGNITSFGTPLKDDNIEIQDFIEKSNISSFYKHLAKVSKINPWLVIRAVNTGDNQEYYNYLTNLFEEDPAVKNYLINIRQTYKDVPFLILINPSKYQVNTKPFGELKKLGFVFNQEKVVDREVQDAIIRWANEENITYVDILPYMYGPDDSYFYKIDDHYTKKGNSLVAKIVYNKLCEMNIGLK